jgi:hypothetical protein
MKTLFFENKKSTNQKKEFYFLIGCFNFCGPNIANGFFQILDQSYKAKN